MLKPSYAELIDILNQNAYEDTEITSRYTIVIAAAKRARQIISGDKPMVTERKGKPLSTAVSELFNNKIKIVPEGEGTIIEFDLPNKNQDYETVTNTADTSSEDIFLNQEHFNKEDFDNILNDQQELDTTEESITEESTTEEEL